MGLSRFGVYWDSIFFGFVSGSSSVDYKLVGLGPVWQPYSNTKLHILNNIIHFFTHMYVKNTQITLLKLTYQISP